MWSGTKWFLIILMSATERIVTEENGTQCQCRPVLLLHGFLEDRNFMATIEERIKEVCPGTNVTNLNDYSDFYQPALWTQIKGDLGRDFGDFCKNNPGGITALGHSQGALLLRALVEIFSNDCVDTLISLAGPQLGVYGIPTFISALLALPQEPLELDLVTDFLYADETQRSFSAANVWTDSTRYEEYLKKNIFLPYINNEKRSNSSQSYKENFLKLKKLVTIWSPDDAIVIPPESGEFSFFDKNKNVVNYQDYKTYTEDLFGIKTLDEDGRWQVDQIQQEWH